MGLLFEWQKEEPKNRNPLWTKRVLQSFFFFCCCFVCEPRRSRSGSEINAIDTSTPRGAGTRIWPKSKNPKILAFWVLLLTTLQQVWCFWGTASCVQDLDDSQNSAIHITYRISLRSSSFSEPRYPLLKVFFFFWLFWFFFSCNKKKWNKKKRIRGNNHPQKNGHLVI